MTISLLPATATTAPTRSRARTRIPRVNRVRVEGHDVAAFRSRVERGPSLMVEQPWRAPGARLRIRLAVLLPVILFLFSLYQNLGNMDTVDFHRDEARWINRAYFLEDLTHPFSATWADYYTTRGQPPLGNYVMGLGLLLQGRDLDTNRVWDFWYEEDWNIRAGAMPEPADLNAGRRTNAVVGAMLVVCVYVLVSRLTNRAGGFAAGLFLSLQPLHLRLSSQALSDELLGLLLAGAFLAAWGLASKPTLGRGILLGVLLGLGGAAKLSPLLLCLPLAGYGMAWLAVSAWKGGGPALAWRRARVAWLLLAQPPIAVATFLAVNPYLWPSPISRTWDLFNFRRAEMDTQSAAWPIAGVESPLEALMRVGRRFNTDYSASLRVGAWIEQTASLSLPDIPLDVVLMAAGLIALCAMVIRHGPGSPHALVMYLMAAESGAVILGMGVDFYRYFLPLLVVGSVCVGVGIGAAVEALVRRRAPHRRATHVPVRPPSAKRA